MNTTRTFKTQLPNDVQLVIYRKCKHNQFEYESIWFGGSANFSGSEHDFVIAGHGYHYVDIDKYTRRVIKDYS